MSSTDESPKKINNLTALLDVGDAVPEFQRAREPIMERKAYKIGLIQVFPPYAPVTSWSDMPWVIKVENFQDHGPKKFKVEPGEVSELFKSPWKLESREYNNPDLNINDAL